MWKRRAIAGLVAALLLGAGPAFAFQDAPPAETSDSDHITTPVMKLGTPSSPSDPKSENKGLKVFGYKVFPRLNFGLDVLYGEKTEQSEQHSSQDTAEENDDVTVLGRIKRLF